MSCVRAFLRNDNFSYDKCLLTLSYVYIKHTLSKKQYLPKHLITSSLRAASSMTSLPYTITTFPYFQYKTTKLLQSITYIVP
jgi:hypothetical protein